MKVCSKCKVEKDYNEFSTSNREKDGKNLYCKKCIKEYIINNKHKWKDRSEYYKKYRIDNKEKLAKKSNQWYIDNKERALSARKLYKEKNRDIINKNNSEYYQKNKGKIRTKQVEYEKNNKDKINKRKRIYSKTEKRMRYQKGYSKNNKEKINANSRKWYIDNKEKALKNNKEWNYNKRKTDYIFALKVNIRNRTYQAFKNKGYKKISRTHDLLGCSFETLKTHIENQFTDGMSWENRS